jgi:hypothetical protein
MASRLVPAPAVRLRRMLSIRSVPAGVILIAALASYAALIIVALKGWPLWVLVSAAIVPWIPLFTAEMSWTYKHYGWLALFYVVTVWQVGHVFEHVAQMYQIHILHIPPPQAHGIFGALDIEWVHVIFNTFVLVSVVLLLRKYRQNSWLWLTLALAGWHQVEHTYILIKYLQTGAAGNPGLLANGGVFPITGLTRPDLHMLYNLVETIPLVAAFLWQLQRVHDQWIGRALPRLPRRLLLHLTNRADIVRVAPGVTILNRGQAADRFFVVSRGRLAMLCPDEGGGERVVGNIGPGQYFGQNALSQAPCEVTVRTVVPTELVVLSSASLRRIADYYQQTDDELAPVFASQAA